MSLEKLTPNSEQSEQFITRYSDMHALRALVQSIPYIGSSLDALLAAPGEKYQRKRIERLEQFFIILKSYSCNELKCGLKRKSASCMLGHGM